MKRTMVLATLGVALTANIAAAEEEIEVTPPSDPTPTPTPTAPTDPGGGGPGPFNKGALGISVPIVGGYAPGYAIDLVYFLNAKAAVDILVGVIVAKTPDDPATPLPADESATAFGFTAGAGYRLYKKINDKLHTYIQPYALFSSLDASAIGDNLVIIAGANFGAEAFLTDWFSFRGQIGGAVSFANKFEVITLASTTGLFANVYWK